MSDEIKTTDTTVDANTEKTVKQEGVISNETQSQEEKKQQDLKGIAKIQANYDRLYEEHKKALRQLDDEKKKSLSQKQLEELEKQEKEREMIKLSRELEEKTLVFEKSKLLFEKQWDNEFLEMVAGNDIDQYKINVEKLNNKINKLVEQKVNERLTKGNPVPNTGKADGDYFTVDEVNNLPKRNGIEWTKQNLDKIQKSIQYWNSKTN